MHGKVVIQCSNDLFLNRMQFGDKYSVQLKSWAWDKMLRISNCLPSPPSPWTEMHGKVVIQMIFFVLFFDRTRFGEKYNIQLKTWASDKKTCTSHPPPPHPEMHGKVVIQTLKWLSYVKRFGNKYSVQLKAEHLIKCCTSSTISPHLLWEETTTLPPMQTIADRHAIFSACNLQSHPESSDQHPCDQQNNYQQGGTG